MTLEEAIASLTRYAEQGVPTGDFLRACLENDFIDAIGRADESSLANLHSIASHIYNEIPDGSWGSPEAVSAWIEKKADERAAIDKAERGA